MGRVPNPRRTPGRRGSREAPLTPALSPEYRGEGVRRFPHQRLCPEPAVGDTHMKRILVLFALGVILASLLAGCGGPPPQKAHAGKATTRPAEVTAILRHTAHSPVVHLDVYQMFVPRGAVIRNDDFWKRVD